MSGRLANGLDPDGRFWLCRERGKQCVLSAPNAPVRGYQWLADGKRRHFVWNCLPGLNGLTVIGHWSSSEKAYHTGFCQAGTGT